MSSEPVTKNAELGRFTKTVGTDVSRDGSLHGARGPSSISGTPQQQSKRDRWRDIHLERVAEQKMPGIILLTGPSGAGKTTVADALVQGSINGKEFNYGTKLVPRSPEEIDYKGDRSWLDFASALAEEGGHGMSGELLMGIRRFEKFYGFTSSSVIASVTEGKNMVFVLGRPVEAFEMQRCLQKRFPLIPVSVVWLDVSKDALVGRLQQREERRPGERDRRLQEIQKERPDEKLLKSLDAHGILRVVLNESTYEHSNCVVAKEEAEKAKRLNVHRTAEGILEINTSAQKRSASSAADLLAPIKIEACRGISQSITEALSAKALPAMRAILKDPEKNVCIIGGLGVSLLSGSEGRTVSLDIDLLYHPTEPNCAIEEVLSVATGTEKEMRRVEKGSLFADATTAKIELANGDLVELDSNRFLGVFLKGGFGYAFHMDDEIRYHLRKVELGKDLAIQVAPPEYLAVQKLLSGRGPEEEKFDFYDAVALLNNHPVNDALIEHLIDMQSFDSRYDRNFAGLSQETSITTEVLDDLGFTDGDIRAQLLGTSAPHDVRLYRDSVDVANNFEAPPQYAYTPTALKRLRMIDGIISAVRRVREQFDDKIWELPGREEKVALSDVFNRGRIVSKLEKLESSVRAKTLRIGLLDFWSKEDPDVVPESTASFLNGLQKLVDDLSATKPKA